jgi:MarR family transcriptional regulator, organic hydroperoxide resistance regulator
MAPTTVTSTDDLDVFTGALDDFMRAIRGARGRLVARDGEDELSLPQFQILDPLDAASEALTVSEVAVQAGVATPTATRMLDGLEREGLVCRERRPGDRRVVHISLTDDGRRRVQAKRARIAARRREIFESLSAAERKQAARVLARLAAAVEDLR